MAFSLEHQNIFQERNRGIPAAASLLKVDHLLLDLAQGTTGEEEQGGDMSLASLCLQKAILWGFTERIACVQTEDRTEF